MGADFLNFGRLVIGRNLHVKLISSQDLTYLIKDLKINHCPLFLCHERDWTDTLAQQVMSASLQLTIVKSVTFWKFKSQFQKKKNCIAQNWKWQVRLFKDRLSAIGQKIAIGTQQVQTISRIIHQSDKKSASKTAPGFKAGGFYLSCHLYQHHPGPLWTVAAFPGSGS